jgi:hypothetical protein
MCDRYPVSVKHLDLAHNQISSWATDPETDGNCYGFQESSSGLCGTPEPRHRVNSLSFLHLFVNQYSPYQKRFPITDSIRIQKQ